MVRRSRKHPVHVTPQGASRALHALHFVRQADNLRIEITAARVLDAYCQGRLIAAEDIADADTFLVRDRAHRAAGDCQGALEQQREGEPPMAPPHRTEALNGKRRASA